MRAPGSTSMKGLSLSKVSTHFNVHLRLPICLLCYTDIPLLTIFFIQFEFLSPRLMKHSLTTSPSRPILTNDRTPTLLQRLQPKCDRHPSLRLPWPRLSSGDELI